MLIDITVVIRILPPSCHEILVHISGNSFEQLTTVRSLQPLMTSSGRLYTCFGENNDFLPRKFKLFDSISKNNLRDTIRINLNRPTASFRKQQNSGAREDVRWQYRRSVYRHHIFASNQICPSTKSASHTQP